MTEQDRNELIRIRQNLDCCNGSDHEVSIARSNSRRLTEIISRKDREDAVVSAIHQVGNMLALCAGSLFVLAALGLCRWSLGKW